MAKKIWSMWLVRFAERIVGRLAACTIVNVSHTKRSCWAPAIGQFIQCCVAVVSLGAGVMRNNASARPTKLSNMSVILPTVLMAIWEQIFSPRSPLYIAQEMTPVNTEIQPNCKAAAQISGKENSLKLYRVCPMLALKTTFFFPFHTSVPWCFSCTPSWIRSVPVHETLRGMTPSQYVRTWEWEQSAARQSPTAPRANLTEDKFLDTLKKDSRDCDLSDLWN